MVFLVGLNSSVTFAVSVDSAKGGKSALPYDTDDSKSLTLAGQEKLLRMLNASIDVSKRHLNPI